MHNILILVLIFFVQNTNANELSCTNINTTLEKFIRKNIIQQYSFTKFQNLSITESGTSFPNNCDYVKFTFPKNIVLNKDLVIRFNTYKNSEFQNRITKIYRFNGKAVVLKTTKKVFKSDKIDKKNLQLKKINVSKLSKHMFGSIDKIKNYEFKNFINEDTILEEWMIQKVPDLTTGDDIKAIIKNGKITLTLDGNILENGNIGETVSLKLKKNKKIFTGKIYDKKTIIISNI